MQDGTVKWFNAAKGFGFITPDDGSDDVFVHYSSVDGQGYKQLTDGQRVRYEVTRGPKGLSASRVIAA